MNTDRIIKFLTIFTEHCKKNIYIFMAMVFLNHLLFDLILNKPRILSDYDRIGSLIVYGVFIFVVPFLHALYKTYYVKENSEIQSHSL